MKKKLVIAAVCTVIIAVGVATIILSTPEQGEIILVSRQTLDKMFAEKETFYLYVGRPNCPDCQKFYPDFEKKVQELKIKIYYFNTKVKNNKKSEMQKYISGFGIEEVPAILEVEKGSVLKVFDGQTKEDMEAFYNRF